MIFVQGYPRVTLRQTGGLHESAPLDRRPCGRKYKPPQPHLEGTEGPIRLGKPIRPPKTSLHAHRDGTHVSVSQSATPPDPTPACGPGSGPGRTGTDDEELRAKECTFDLYGVEVEGPKASQFFSRV